MAAQYDPNALAEINRLRIAHGVLASLAWVIFFPAGAISIRLWDHRWSVWLHAAFQVFAYALFIAGVGIGINLGMKIDTLVGVDGYIFMESHPIIGLVIFGLVFFQPILGLAHHFFFRKYAHRTVWSHAHIWLGRILITLGIINGGLGFYITEGYQEGIMKGEIVYGVIAGVVWIVYVAAAVFGEIKRARSGSEARKTSASSDSDVEKEQQSVGAGKSENGL